MLKRLRSFLSLAALLLCFGQQGFSQNDSLLFIQGHKAALKGNFHVALHNFDKIIAHKPKSENAWRDRGSCYMDMGKYDQALVDYNTAIQLDSNDALAFENRGILYTLMKMQTEALTDFKKVIQLDSCCTSAYCSYGSVMNGMKKYDEALTYFAKAAQLAAASDRANCYCEMGHTYLLKGSYKKAVHHLSLAITIDPKFADAYKYRAEAHKELQNMLAYKEDTDKYIKLSKKSKK